MIDIDEMKIVSSLELYGYPKWWKPKISDWMLVYVTQDYKTLHVIDIDQMKTTHSVQIKDPNAYKPDEPKLIYPLTSKIKEFTLSNSKDKVSAILAYQLNQDDYSFQRVMVCPLSQEGEQL